MIDPAWDAAWQAVSPLLRDDDVVAAPDGDWPRGRCALVPYRGAIALDGVSVLFLHKGFLPALPKPDLRRLLAEWQCVFANGVFVCFTRERRVRLDRRLTLLQRRHFRRIRLYLASDRLKRRPDTTFFIHLPKTAGTSVWDALRRRVPSSIYYDNAECFLHNPPRPGEYDLVGGHVPYRMLAPVLRPGDRVAGVLREPTDRFRAAWLHSRRAHEDERAMTPVMRVLRRTRLADALDRHEVGLELRQQLLMLGFGFDRPYAFAADGAVLADTLAWIAERDPLLGTTEALAPFTAALSASLGLPPVPLRALNRSDHALQAADLAEFETVRERVVWANRTERELYAHVGRRARAGGARVPP